MCPRKLSLFPPTTVPRLLAIVALLSVPLPSAADPSGQSDGLLDLQGRSHTLADYRGRKLLIIFWTSWCTACLREFPSLERFSRARGEASDGPVVLAVNVREGAGQARRFRRLEDAGMRILRDASGRFADAWGVRVYPTTILLDENGDEVRRLLGEVDWDSVDMDDLFQPPAD